MNNDDWWLAESRRTSEQNEVIELPIDKDYLLLGPPGSGKTNLVLARALNLNLNKRSNWRIVVFTGALQRWIAAGASGRYRLSPEKFSTIMSFTNELLRDNGLTQLHNDDLEKAREEAIQSLSEILKTHPKLASSFSCILVDETQDCDPRELDLFSKLADNVFLAGDSRQVIYKTKANTLQYARSIVDQTIELKYHYRNGREICRAADAIAKSWNEPPILPTSLYDEGLSGKSSVCFHRFDHDADLLRELVAQLLSQLKSFPNESLAVACPTREELTAALETVMQEPKIAPFVCQHINGPKAYIGDERVFFYTYHSLKGTEFRAVNMIHAEKVKVFREHQKKLSYTTLTRAKTVVEIYTIGPLPAHLQPARDAVEAPRAIRSHADVFKGGGE